MTYPINLSAQNDSIVRESPKCYWNLFLPTTIGLWLMSVSPKLGSLDLTVSQPVGMQLKATPRAGHIAQI